MKRVFQVALILYMAALAIGSLPLTGGPLAPASLWAKDQFARFTLRPGMSVFPGREEGPVLKAVCTDVLGVRADGSVHVLYRRACPPTGFVWGHDRFERMMQRMSRTLDEHALVALDGEVPRRASKAVRRFLDLGHYFCHSPLAGTGDYREIRLALQQYRWDVDTGRDAPWAPLRCTWTCLTPDAVAVPRCDWVGAGTRRGADAP